MAIYVIDSFGSDTELLVRAVAQTVTLANYSRFSEGAIAVHKRRQVASSIIWKEAIGGTATKNLAKGRAIIDRCTMHLLTERIDSADFSEGPNSCSCHNNPILE